MTTRFKCGARPTPRHKLAAATPHGSAAAPPPQFAVVPKQLSMWGNDNYPDCVSAEEAFAKAAFSVMNGLPEVFVPYDTVTAWAQQNGFLNGADLTSVMDAMAKSGFVVNGVTYGDGPYLSVDYSNEPALQAAIAEGPVKIGIDHDALPSTAGNGNGWYATGGAPGQYANEDHCVGLCGYGTAAFLFGQLGLPVPAALSPTATGYLLFTWSSIGFVDHAWIMSTCGEAWVRNPTTPGQTPSPTPVVPPIVPPLPPAPSDTITLTGTVVIPAQTVQVPTGPLRTTTVTIPAQSVPVSVSGPAPTHFLHANGTVLDGPLMKLLHQEYLVSLLTHAGMPGAVAAVQAGDWQTILQWVLTNLPTILAAVAQIISLITALSG